MRPEMREENLGWCGIRIFWGGIVWCGAIQLAWFYLSFLPIFSLVHHNYCTQWNKAQNNTSPSLVLIQTVTEPFYLHQDALSIGMQPIVRLLQPWNQILSYSLQDILTPNSIVTCFWTEYNPWTFLLTCTSSMQQEWQLPPFVHKTTTISASWCYRW